MMQKQLGFFKPPKGPDLTFEKKFEGLVAGIDEVGRGPLAGPVIAAAVILDYQNIPEGLNDSKKLTQKKREALFVLIKETCCVGIGQASVQEIDELNILKASHLAMRRAVKDLPQNPKAFLVDGNQDPGLSAPTKCLVKGDALSLSIAAASIIAKVFRDGLMAELAKDHPEYGWAQNAGYGVPHHLKALNNVGPTPHHRKSFHPVKRLLLKESALTD